MFALLYTGILVVAMTFDGLLGTKGIVYGIALIALIIPMIACQIRRMHDQDRSGWWILVPIAGFIFLFIEGTKGDNRFGPDPKAGIS